MLIRKKVSHFLPLYLVIGLEHVNGRSALDIAKAAIAGGITMLQLREKEAPLSRVLSEGRRLRELCRQAHIPFIVNDRVDVALLLEADGVHVGQDDIPCIEARKLLGGMKIVGVSASDYEEAEQAVRDGADYLGVGSVYATTTKADAGEPVGAGLIADIARSFDTPQVGIGGITLENAAEVVRAGACGIAVVSAITAQPSPEMAAKQLRFAVESAKEASRRQPRK